MGANVIIGLLRSRGGGRVSFFLHLGVGMDKTWKGLHLGMLRSMESLKRILRLWHMWRMIKLLASMFSARGSILVALILRWVLCWESPNMRAATAF